MVDRSVVVDQAHETGDHDSDSSHDLLIRKCQNAFSKCLVSHTVRSLRVAPMYNCVDWSEQLSINISEYVRAEDEEEGNVGGQEEGHDDSNACNVRVGLELGAVADKVIARLVGWHLLRCGMNERLLC